MSFLYNLFVYIAGAFIGIAAVFSPKLKLFVNGRKTVFKTLKDKISENDKTIWFHAASLGEYEQGLPVIEKVKENFPNHKIVLTFFSPSGYEIRKNNTVADVTVYLPLDTKSNAKKFVKLVHPEMAFFIKYEFWVNYLNELKKANIRTFLISGILRENHIFFKWYGGFYRKCLDAFEHFFMQNETSQKLLQSIGYNNVTVSGDTRFDRVAAILERDNHLDFVEEFKQDKLTVVAGSTWQPDEKLLVNYINQCDENTKFIIAPHTIKQEQISNLKSQIQKKTVLYSEIPKQVRNDNPNNKLSDYDVFIIDTIGILTKIYSYADIAYVGGGFGTGLHNILEPAAFGVPVVIGENYSQFAEAEALVEYYGSCFSVRSQDEFDDVFKTLHQAEIRIKFGKICGDFVQRNKGATDTILKYICTTKNS